MVSTLGFDPRSHLGLPSSGLLFSSNSCGYLSQQLWRISPNNCGDLFQQIGGVHLPGTQ